MNKKTVAIIAILAVAFATQVLWKSAPEEKTLAVVRDRFVSAEGKVEVRSGFEVEVGSPIEGKIGEFMVKEGDRVNRGDILAVMENKDIEAKLGEAVAELAVSRSKLRELEAGARSEEVGSAQAVLAEAQIALEYAQTDLRRYRALYEKVAATRQALDDKERQVKIAGERVAKAMEEKRLVEKGARPETIQLEKDHVKHAEAVVEYYQRLLDKTQITAPISGKIIRKYLEAGECATKELPLVAIADLGKLWVNAEVDESDIGRLKKGDRVEMRADAFPGHPFQGEIEEIADYAGVRKVRPGNQTKNLDVKVVQVKIRLMEPTPLKPGMTVEVAIQPRKPNP